MANDRMGIPRPLCARTRCCSTSTISSSARRILALIRSLACRHSRGTRPPNPSCWAKPMKRFAARHARQAVPATIWSLYEIDDAVEAAAGAYPCVHRLAHVLHVAAEVFGAEPRRQRRSDHPQTVCVCCVDQAPIAGDEIGRADWRLACLACVPDVVEALEPDEIGCAGDQRDVAIEARNPRGVQDGALRRLRRDLPS